jgi:BT1 family
MVKQGYFSTLTSTFGYPLLTILFFTQHILKGFVMSLSVTSTDFLLRERSLTGPQLQMYKAIIALPWALKPLIGILSDVKPIFGFNKAPYMLLTTLLGVGGFFLVSYSDSKTELILVVGSLFSGNLFVSTCDLLTEAAYSAKVKSNPEHGPDLVTYVWSGVTMGSFIAVAMVGYLIDSYGVRSVYWICGVVSGTVIFPILFNCLEEQRISPEEEQVNRDRIFKEEKEVVLLSLIVGGCVIGLASVGLVTESVEASFYTSLIIGFLVLSSFTLLLRPDIGKVNAFYFIQTMCAVSIEGATFYFFTDNKEQYPGGPNFSVKFYTTVVGLVGATFNLIGLWTYNSYTKQMKYRGLFLYTNIILCMINLFSVMLYSRLLVNVIPDKVFVLCGAALQSSIATWMWVPGVVLMAQLCPNGMEAAMYALLAGCHNIGGSVTGSIGAFMLEKLGTTPKGDIGEGEKFQHLWIAALIATLTPVLSLFLVPYCVPDAVQTDVILSSNPHSATAGSPYEQWFKPKQSNYKRLEDEQDIEEVREENDINRVQVSVDAKSK